MSTMNASRRLFLRHAGMMSAIGAAGGPLASTCRRSARPRRRPPPTNKAIVCLFLFGGNDSINMVLPTDAASFANYTTLRSQAPDPIALLAAGTAANAGAANGSLARLGGVRPSRRPMRRPQLRAAPGDGHAANHVRHRQAAGDPAQRRHADPADQQDAVRAGLASQAGEPVLAQRPAEHLAVVPARGRDGGLGRAHGRPAGVDEFACGVHLDHRRRQCGLAVGQRGAPVPGDEQRRDPPRHQRFRPGLRLGGGGPGDGAHRADHARRPPCWRWISAVAARSMQAESLLRNALKPASDPLFGTAPASGSYNATNDPKLRYTDPNNPGTTIANPLAQQMQVVARIIEASGNADVGAKRQVFFVSLGGFDTHDAQNNNHAQLMARGACAALLRRHAGRPGPAQPGHHLHGERLRPHLHQQRRRHRSRLGCASLRDGRRGARR